MMKHQTDSVRLNAGCTKRRQKSSGGRGGGHISVSDSKLSPTPDVSKTTWLLRSVESKNDKVYLKGSQPFIPSCTLLNTLLISSRMINNKCVGVCRGDGRPPAELNQDDADFEITKTFSRGSLCFL